MYVSTVKLQPNKRNIIFAVYCINKSRQNFRIQHSITVSKGIKIYSVVYLIWSRGGHVLSATNIYSLFNYTCPLADLSGAQGRPAPPPLPAPKFF